MRILSRYFLASYLTFFVTILIASMMAITVIEMLVNFDEIFGEGNGLADAAGYLFLQLPVFYARDLLPAASFAAAFFCVGLPARRHEFTAIKAGGISPQRVCIPILFAAAMLTIGTFFINETVALGASREWGHFGRNDDGVEFRRGTFWYHRGNTIYNVYSADPEHKTLHVVTIFELAPNGRLLRSIAAKSVQIVDELNWAFQNATVRTFDPGDPLKPPKIERVERTVLVVGAPQDLALLNADAGTLSLGDLLDFIDGLAAQGRDTAPYEAMYHGRLTAPLTVLLFAFLAIPLGLRVEQTRSVAPAAIRAIGVVAAFYVLRWVTNFAVSRGVPLSAVAPFTHFAIFATFGIWQFARIRH